MNEIKTSNNAPLIIFCYNRLNSLEKVIKSVQKNKLVHSTDIYLFSDGPKINNPQDPAKVLEVREYINSLENFQKHYTYMNTKKTSVLLIQLYLVSIKF